jgi:hypothetical protein
MLGIPHLLPLRGVESVQLVCRSAWVHVDVVVVNLCGRDLRLRRGLLDPRHGLRKHLGSLPVRRGFQFVPHLHIQCGFRSRRWNAQPFPANTFPIVALLHQLSLDWVLNLAAVLETGLSPVQRVVVRLNDNVTKQTILPTGRMSRGHVFRVMASCRNLLSASTRKSAHLTAHRPCSRVGATGGGVYSTGWAHLPIRRGEELLVQRMLLRLDSLRAFRINPRSHTVLDLVEHVRAPLLIHLPRPSPVRLLLVVHGLVALL